MRYYLAVALKYMKQHMKLYIMIGLELVLCFTFIYLGMNKTMSETNRRQLLTDQFEKTVLIHRQDYSPIDLSSEQIALLEQSAGQKEALSYAKIARVIVQKSNEYDVINVIVANQTFLDTYTHQANTVNRVFFSETLDHLLHDNPSIPEMNIVLQDQHVKIGNERIEKEVFSLSSKMKTLITGIDYLQDIDLSSAMLMSAEMYDRLKENLPLSFTQSFCGVNENINMSQFMQTIHQQSKFSAKLEPIFVLPEFQKGTQNLMEFLTVFSWASYMALLIVVTGVVGVLLIFLERRKKCLMVALIFGASRLKLFMELFIEFLILMGVSSAIALCICWGIQPSISTVYYLIDFSGEVLLLAMILPVILTLLVLILFSSYFIGLDCLKGVKHDE